MKKIWMLGLALSITLAGCGSEQPEEENVVTGGEEPAAEEVNVKAELMDYYLNLTTTVNGIDADLNSYEAALGGEEPPTAEAKEAAVASANEVAEVVNGTEIPETLTDVKEDLESFKTALAESYTMKAEEIAKEGEANLEAANAKFTEADEQISSILEEAGLTASSLAKDLN